MTHKIMSKLSQLINGDSTSLSDAIAGNRDSRAMRSKDYLREDWSEKAGKTFTCDVDHMYASANDMQSKDREISQLKEMNIAHLDLIQRQFELLTSKDKEIAQLRGSMEAMAQRCQRMERRVTLQRHKDDPVASPAPPPVVVPSIPSTSVLAVPPAPLSPASPNEHTPKRRRSSATCVSRRKRRTISEESAGQRKRTCSASGSNGVERRARSRKIMTTDSMYLTASGVQKDVWKPSDLMEAPEPLPQEEVQVQVPSWREKILTPHYSIEGTENLDDEVFLKRHQKHEFEERRRKRWDIQRMREQTHVEKLKQRGLKGRGKSSGDCETSPEGPVYSFFPSCDEVKEVIVDSQLPVVAFGLPLRVFEPTVFKLPWKRKTPRRSR